MHRTLPLVIAVALGVPPAGWARAAEIAARLETVAPVSWPTSIAAAPGDTQRLFVTERQGRIRIIKGGVLLPTPFIDISALVSSSPGERALAAVAFHPNYRNTGAFFVTYTDLNGDGVVARLDVTTDPEIADPASHAVLLTIPQPSITHNLGWLGFGPDGLLYIAAGDGGASTEGVFAQDTASLLGKILRIDVDGGPPYAIPPTNPFVGAAGLDEIWAYGLRNPWRCSFDRVTGDLWIADVGNSMREEVDFQPAGAGGLNYGWHCMEGSLCHTGEGCTCNAPTLTDPVHDYDHTQGCAIIGGSVYHGSLVPALSGLYVFGDLCSGALRAYDPLSGNVSPLSASASSIISMGEDLDGELYVCTTSEVLRLTFPDCNANGNADYLDISDGTSDDCNGNGTPDECETIDCNGNSVPDECDIDAGTSLDLNGNGIPDECDMLADLDGDRVVGVTDLLLLLGSWGPCPGPPDPCDADISGDGSVGVVDLLLLLASWTY